MPHAYPNAVHQIEAGPMMKLFKRMVMPITKKIMPGSLKDFLFRFSFAVMTESQQFQMRCRYNMASLDWCLRNLARLGFKPTVIFDVGAYEGEWTESARKAFPEAAIVMVEAQPGKQAKLKQAIERAGGQIACEITLLGPMETDSVNFYEMETGSSLLHEQCNAARTKVTRPMTTLDKLAHQHGGKIDFLKLDVQGYELEVLKGGEATLKQVEVVLMEVSLLGVIQGAPLLDETVSFMKLRGFVAYDICTLMRRPLDLALWQVDMLFVRHDSALVSNHTKGD